MAQPSKRVARQIPRQYDEDEDDNPHPRRTTGDDEVHPAEEEEDDDGEGAMEATALRRGWSAGQQEMDSTSSFAQAFKPTEQYQTIKFLEDEPYVNYKRHWMDRQTPTGVKPRSYTCLRSFSIICPLCEQGDRAQAVSAFNIAVIGDDGVAVLKSWDCGPKIFGILKAHAADPKVTPLTKGYFMVKRTGKMGTVNHEVRPISGRGLEEDYEITLPTPAELAKLGKWDESIIPRPKIKDLEAIAAEVADEY